MGYGLCQDWRGYCWNQWFSETACSMALMGAEVLFYPTAIGSELLDLKMDSSGHWQRVMQGHAGVNLMSLVASNRIGIEQGKNGTELDFYGSPFIADNRGDKVAEMNRITQGFISQKFDLDELAQ